MNKIKSLIKKLNNKQGLTLVEVLLVTVIFSMILLISTELLRLSMDTTILSLTGFNNRPKIYENTFYMLNEIQSADNVELVDNGKQLIVNYTDGRSSLLYKIEDESLKVATLTEYVQGEDSPLDVVTPDIASVIEINSAESYFEVDGKVVTLTLTMRGLDTGKLQKETQVVTKIFIRSR